MYSDRHLRAQRPEGVWLVNDSNILYPPYTGASLESDTGDSHINREQNYLNVKKKKIDEMRREIARELAEQRYVAGVFQRNAMRLSRYDEYTPVHTMAELDALKNTVKNTGNTDLESKTQFTEDKDLRWAD